MAGTENRRERPQREDGARQTIGTLLMGVLVATGLSLVVVLGLSGTRYDALVMEYLATQTLTDVADEAFSSGALPDELPEEVDAFGVYESTGVQVVGTANAPGQIDMSAWEIEPGESRVGVQGPGSGLHGNAVGGAASGLGSTTRIIRSDRNHLELLRAVGGRGPGAGVGSAGRAGARGATNGPGSTGRTYVYLRYDVSGIIQSGRWRLTGLGVVLIVVGGMALSLVRVARAARLAEARARHQEQLAQLGAAARTITHEIKNPLASIRLQTALLRKLDKARRTVLSPDSATTAPDRISLPPDTRSDAPLDAIDREVQRLGDLIDRVRDFLKDPLGTVQPIEVNKFIADLVKRSVYSVVYEPGVAEAFVCVDPHRFETVIGNLITNAAESMQSVAHPVGRGTQNRAVGIGGEPQAAQPVELSIESTDRLVRIVVGDRGEGIPPAVKSRIFDPFFTTKENGSGVGLSAAAAFVHAVNGTITLSERSGGGMLATIELPRRDAGACTHS